MTPKRPRPRGTAASLRLVAERGPFGLFAAIAIAFLVFAKAEAPLVDAVRRPLSDLFAPVLSVIADPAQAMRHAVRDVGELFAIRAENARLRAENERLLAWRQEAARLQVQNAALRDALAMPPLPRAPATTTARMVADAGSSFVHARLLDAGADRGVAPGMAVMGPGGLVGRVVDVGRRSARLLLLTDFNSRLPVLVDRTRDRGILSGDNDTTPALTLLPLNPRFRVGDTVSTSGDGGLMPPGLPVGRIERGPNGEAVVAPFVDWTRLDYVQIVANQALPAPEDDPVVDPESLGDPVLGPPPWL